MRISHAGYFNVMSFTVISRYNKHGFAKKLEFAPLWLKYVSVHWHARTHRKVHLATCCALCHSYHKIPN